MNKVVMIMLILVWLLVACAPMVTPLHSFATVIPTFVPTNSVEPIVISTPVSTSPSWPDPANIFDANKRLNRTVNLANAYEIWSNGEWSIESEKYFNLISLAGFTAVRIPIEFSNHALTVAPYTIDTLFTNTVKWIVDTSNHYGLVAIIDMHNYSSLMDNPTDQSERFLALWKQISEQYQNYPNGQVYFELLNEPNGGLDFTHWNDLLAKAIFIIRQTNPLRPIIVDGEADWSPAGSLNDLKLPNDPNIIVTFHYYRPAQFTHQGADWIIGSHAWLGTTWEGTPLEMATIASDFDWVAGWAKSNQRPIFMGEFGALSTADQASRVRWITAVRTAAEQHGFSWGYWDFCTRLPGFGVYDIDAQTWHFDLLNALIPNQ